MHSRGVRRISFWEGLEHMARAVARAPGVWGGAPSGVQGQSPWWGLGGEAPLKLKAFCCETSKGSSN